MSDTQQAETIYIAPDIRTQTIEEAYDFIEAKRAARLVLVMDYQEKQNASLTKSQDKNDVAFRSQQVRVDKALSKLNEELDKAKRAVDKLSSIHNTLTNIEERKKEV